MTAIEVFSIARASGIVLEANGDTLIVDAPIGGLSPEIRDALVHHKPVLLAMLASADLVSLRGGLVVPRPALELALDLEARGFRLSLDCYQQFQIEPGSASDALTSAERNGIARWRSHLAALVGYEPPIPDWLQ
jgi:hypothetical protein